MLNQVPLQSTVRNPRALIKINDRVIRTIDSIEYVENNYYQPDTFHVEMPLYINDGVINIEYWLSQPAIMCEIFMGFPTDPTNYGVNDLDSFILGGVNNVEVKVFENGAGTVSFDGFDLSKKFIDNKTYEKYPNLTPSQIATKLANTRGLTPVVTESGPPYAGYYYNKDYVQPGNAVTEWDLLTYLAQRIGYQVFVRGKTLYFQPRPIQSSNPYVMQAQTLEGSQSPSFNGTRLMMTRNLNYARDVIVRVRSWNAKSGRVDVTARAKPTQKTVLAAAAQPIGEAQLYDYVIPGLSNQQATQRAQQLLEQISQHERLLDFTTPADGKGYGSGSLLRKDTLIQLKGVSASADQMYFPDTISRRISTGGTGYVMEVRAKNHSPQSTTII